MSELDITIGNLKTKIEKLVHLHQQLKKENKQLQSTIDELKQIIDNQKNTIEKLENSHKEILKTKNEEENRSALETEQKINELVQEIDLCLALLKN